jgi:CO dehydrogenase maturation factor
MTTYIAIVGKGGVGKTAIASLLIDLLSKKGVVLAIDGDPSTNLNTALGMKLNKTVGQVREKTAKDIQANTLPAGVAKMDVLEQRIRESLVEGDDIDLLAMGRPEGPGCYCAANTMLRQSIDRLGQNYKYVVIDNEAGMEHISRQTTRDIDYLIAVTDPTARGVTTALRMKELIGELRTKVGRVGLVINRLRGELPPELKAMADAAGMEILAAIGEDLSLPALEVKGQALTGLPEGSPLKAGVKSLAGKLGL